MRYVDCHVHSEYSHDGKVSVREICEAAIRLGLSGVAITDHCDIEFYHERPERENIIASVEDAKRLQDEFGDALHVRVGVELGEAIWDMSAADEMCGLFEYDVVLGSVHAVRGWEEPFSRIKAGDVDSHIYLSRYFDDVLETVKTCDFDVLCHLTCPLRYIIGRFGETVDLSRYDQQIDDILQELIRNKRALEVNTSGFGTAYDRLLPDTDILERYYAMGGRLITLASDAHTADRPGIGFDAAVQKLKAIGFSHACDFEKRKPILYEL